MQIHDAAKSESTAWIALARSALVVALAAAPHAVALAADGLLTLSAGAEYTGGKFGGTERTDTFYIPVAGKYETGPWAYKLVVPYIRITGPGNVSGSGEDRVTTVPSGNAQRRTESGLGDIVASAFYNLVNERTGQFGLDVGAKAKLGTADETRGLGTGKNDYSLQADVFKPSGAFTAFGTLGFRYYGDPPGVDLRNVFYGSVGGAYRVSQPTTVGMSYDFRDRIVAGGARVSELIAYVSQRYPGNWKLQLYAVTGFSDASPDFGVGLTLSQSF